ncbi:DNA ligase [Chloropicon primus]|nr:DNA ligase [Chloropicon primus]
MEAASTSGGAGTIPRHKGVPGTGFVVDGFKACGKCKRATAFFLTHAHGDHYDGLNEKWSREIYCSTITANLVHMKLGVERSLMREMNPGDEAVVIEGVEVSVVDANHCPGAVQFLFVTSQGDRFIHSGDCRFHTSMKRSLQLFRKSRILFLDTTYCNPKHTFPCQEHSIQYVVDKVVKREALKERGKCLFLISSYNIGKERIFLAVHRATGKKLYATPKKIAHLELLQIDELTSALTDDPRATNIHLVKWNALGETWPYFRPNFVQMEEYRQMYGVEETMGFVPTGWTYEGKGTNFSSREKGPDRVFLVPYSEHSSFSELVDYVKFIKPEEVVPTVNIGETPKMLKHFRNLIDENSAKRRFLSAFTGGAPRKARKSDVAVKDEGPAVKSSSGKEDGPCDLLMAATGLKSLAEAQFLLKRANGDLEKAANFFFEDPFRKKVEVERPPRQSVKKGSTVVGQMPLSSFFGGAKSGGISLGSPKHHKTVEKSLEAGAQAAAGRGGSPCKALADYQAAVEREDYDPLSDALWSSGQPAPYMHLAGAFDAISQTKKRLKISRILLNMFRSLLVLSPESTVASVYLTIGTLGAEFSKMTLDIGASTVSQCISEVTGVSRQRLRQAYNDEGDLGDVAVLFKSAQTTLMPVKPLTISDVFAKLERLAKESGGGSSTRKKQIATDLIRASKGPETRYMVRTLVQCMRIGANRTSILQSLARASVFHHHREGNPTKERLDEAVDAFEKAYFLCPDIEEIVRELILKGAVESKLKPGIPVTPMLAKPSTGVENAVELMGEEEYICEYKFDGQRAQIHLEEGGKVSIFSRNLDDKTASSCVVDCEIVAVERSSQGYRLLSFQELSARPRGDAQKGSGDVALFVFDILHLDGNDTYALALSERHELLKRALPRRREGFVMLATSVAIPDDSNRVEATRSALLASLRAGCEGLMLKRLAKTYEPGRRSDQWIKLKKDYCEELQDSLDLVPIGAWWGNGRKAGWFSPFLMAAWDPEREEFQSVCRVMSGFSDEFYKKSREFFDQHLIDGPKGYYNTGEKPAVWFSPVETWEIRGADITVSPVHRAAFGKVHESRGLALRFPRFVRKRPDKTPEEATSSDQICEMFQAQTVKCSLRNQQR